MATQRYSVTQPHIETIFAWIQSGEIAIPEIQRPFVWDASKVRDLLDSLFQGYPTGYLIAWRNPDVKLKDGTTSSGKRIIIDGQQRITALMASLLGYKIVDDDYRKKRITIAFHPAELKFEVSNPAIAKDSVWIADISVVFDNNTSILDLVNEYCRKNTDTKQDDVFRSIERLKAIISNQIGLIELDGALDIETVTEIFIRVNSAGVPLSQADFAMSKIAVNETYGGHILRKAIDYFCHMAVAPEFYTAIAEDEEFTSTEFFEQMKWIRKENDDIYDPSYTDMLRVAFTSEFKRGRLQDLVALLSGRNFETRQYESSIVSDSFDKLKQGILRFTNENNFKKFVLIIKSAGFITGSMIGSQNALNFAYVLYLSLKSKGIPDNDIERYVRKWFVMSVLTGRYSGSPESVFDLDIRQIHSQGIDTYLDTVMRGLLSDAFWTALLPQSMDTSVASSPYFRVFQAAQIKMNDKGFLSNDIFVRDLIEIKSDIHHIFPKEYLKSNGMSRSQYNQIANYATTQSEINIAIGAKEPVVYFEHLLKQCNGGADGKLLGNIRNEEELKRNLDMHCIPHNIKDMRAVEYSEFLAIRRKLMAEKMRNYFESL